MRSKQKYTKVSWLIIAVVILFVALPAGILSKLLTDDVNPYLVSALRYAIVFIVLLPFIISAFIKHRDKMMKNLPLILVCSIVASIGTPFYFAALSMSNVSFTEVITLLDPIMFAIISILVTKDKISSRSAAGLLFAVLGGLVVMVFPFWFGEGAVVNFGWLPAVYMIICVATTAFVPVFFRKTDEAGIPMTATIGIMFFFTSLTSFIMAVVNDGPEVLLETLSLSLTDWLILIYLAVAVTIVVRFVRIKAYEHIGTAAHAVIGYLYCIACIAAPVVVLGEELSWEMILGMILIIIGMILTGSQKPTKKKAMLKLHKKKVRRLKK